MFCAPKPHCASWVGSITSISSNIPSWGFQEGILRSRLTHMLHLLKVVPRIIGVHLVWVFFLSVCVCFTNSIIVSSSSLICFVLSVWFVNSMQCLFHLRYLIFHLCVISVFFVSSMSLHNMLNLSCTFISLWGIATMSCVTSSPINSPVSFLLFLLIAFSLHHQWYVHASVHTW